MAKTQVKNYKFTPGLGSEGNLYPNAYALLNANKAFLQAESTAYINKEIADTAKCKRDIGLIIEGTAFDVAFGSNYNALFLGRAESYSIDNSETVYRTIDRALNHMLLIPQVAADSTAKARVKDTINEIKNNPDSRRMILSAWNPNQINEMALPPCHTMAQFRVMNGKLSCQLYQRSADMFLGVPFNIASYSLLTHMLAQLCNLKVGSFVWVGGDCHIYKNHKKQVLEQLKRTPKSLPNLEMPSFSNLDELLQTRPIGYVLKNYDPMDSIKAPMAI